MLKVFRENLKSLHWVLWAVIAVFILLVFVDYGRGTAGLSRPDSSVVKIGDESVTWSEYQFAYQRMEQQYRAIYRDQFSDQLAEQLRRQALQQLIDEKIMIREARSMGLKVSDDELREAIFETPTFKDENGRFVGDERYAEMLRGGGFTPASYEAQVRDGLLFGKLNQILASNLYVSEQEVEDTYRQQVERASIRYLQLPQARFAQQARATDEELAAYFEENKAEYRMPEQRTIAYLLVEKPRLRNELEFTDEEIEAFYDANRDDFTQEERVRARHILLQINDERSEEQAIEQMNAIRQRILNGEEFAAVAAEVSEDPGSKDRGGDLSYFGRGQMVPDFENAAFGAEVGTLTEPVVSGFGVHLIEVLDKQAGGLQSLDEVRGQVRNRLAADRVDARADELATELLEAARAEGGPSVERLEALANEYPAVRFATTEPFGQQDLIPGIGRANEVVESVFELEIGQLAEETLRTLRGPAIAMLTDIAAPRTPSLDEVEIRVRQAVEQTRQRELAADALTTAKQRIAAGEITFDEAAEEFELTVNEGGEVDRNGIVPGLGLNREIADGALALDTGDLGGPVEVPLGVVLYEVTERKRFDVAEFEEQKETTRLATERQKLERLMDAMVQERRRDGTVAFPDAAIREQLGFSLEGP